MTGWSISRAAFAAALVSVAAVPALAQHNWTPPQQSDDSGYQSSQDDRQGYDDAAPYDRDRSADSGADDYSAPPSYGQSTYDDQDPADDGSQSSSSGGFDSRDSTPPALDNAAPAPRDEAHGWGTWRSTSAPIRSEDPNAGLPAADAPPPAQPDSIDSGSVARPDTDANTSLDANPEQAPGTINSFDQSDPNPGVAVISGIDNRNQAVSSCLAAVRSRIGGGAGASRVDGINGEWMVSGAIADGRAFYCSIRHGAVDDVQFGS
jgi:hypothetical protein